MTCYGCSIEVAEHKYLKCKTCKFAFCFACLKVPHNQSLAKEAIESLKCPACTNVTRRRVNDNTPIQQSSGNDTSSFMLDDDSMNMSCDNPKQISSPDPASHLKKSANLSIETISQLFDAKLSPTSNFMMNLRAALREDVKTLVNAEVSTAIQLLKDDFTTTTDFLAAEQSDIKSEIKRRDETIKTLESSNLELQNQIREISGRLSTMEKISRDCNVEVQAVPEKRSENVLTIFKNICETLKVPIVETEIRACRRVSKVNSNSDRPRNILVTLSSPRQRDLVISAALRYNKAHPNEKLNSVNAGIIGQSSRIYVNEHLSSDSKKLHASARAFAKEKSYKYVWVRFGRIFVRKADDCDAIQIRNLECIKKLEQVELNNLSNKSK